MDLGVNMFRVTTGALGPLVATALWSEWRRRRSIDLTGEADGLDDSDMVVCRQLASRASPVAGEPLVKQLAAGPTSYEVS